MRSQPRTSERRLRDLRGVGPAALRDLRILGIESVAQLAREEPGPLYERLCDVTGQRHDPCCQDVFSSAIAQARNPELEPEKRDWWYWSRLRKQSQR